MQILHKFRFESPYDVIGAPNFCSVLKMIWGHANLMMEWASLREVPVLASLYASGRPNDVLQQCVDTLKCVSLASVDVRVSCSACHLKSEVVHVHPDGSPPVGGVMLRVVLHVEAALRAQRPAA